MRARLLLLLVLVGSSLLGSGRALAQCTPVTNCTSSLTCTTPFDSQCTSFCASPITCSTGLDSQCAACLSGYVLQENGVQDACVVPDDCAPGTASATGKEPCTACAAGNFAAGSGQQACSTCTAGCASGQYVATACSATSDLTCGTCDPSCTTCSGASAAECSSCPTGDAPVGGVCTPGCLAAPASGCRLPVVGGKAKLDVKDNVKDAKDLLHWSWAKGSATALAEFGDPSSTDAYFLCVYDGGSRVTSAQLPAGETCGKKPCWSARKKFLAYRDPLLTPDGVLSAKLVSGAAGKASIAITARGVDLDTPDVAAFSGPIRVQLQRADGGICFESVFSAPFKKNAKGTFSDVAD